MEYLSKEQYFFSSKIHSAGANLKSALKVIAFLRFLNTREPRKYTPNFVLKTKPPSIAASPTRLSIRRARHAPQWYKISQPMERSPTDGRTLSRQSLDSHRFPDSRQRERNKGGSLTARPVTQYRAYRSALGKWSAETIPRNSRTSTPARRRRRIPHLYPSRSRFNQKWRHTARKGMVDDEKERNTRANMEKEAATRRNGGRDGDPARNALASSLIIR